VVLDEVEDSGSAVDIGVPVVSGEADEVVLEELAVEDDPAEAVEAVDVLLIMLVVGSVVVPGAITPQSTGRVSGQLATVGAKQVVV
jgi:hypothetical protein